MVRYFPLSNLFFLFSRIILFTTNTPSAVWIHSHGGYGFPGLYSPPFTLVERVDAAEDSLTADLTKDRPSSVSSSLHPSYYNTLLREMDLVNSRLQS